jgi:serine/threonine-protein kinase
MVSRFMTEARAASAIRHPNIVDVLDMGYDADELTLYIVQELLLGEDLATRLEREGTLGVAAALDLAVPVLGALVSAHRAGIIHRDVKPENVMLGAFGEVYLVDWGIARRRSAAPEAELVGTPAYMAPEMLDPDTGRIDARTDVYLLGGVLHALLTGRPPNAGATLTEVCRSALRGGGDILPPDVPRALAALCRAALSRSPEERPATVGEFRDALLAWLRRRAAEALGLSALARAAAVERLADDVDGGRAPAATLESAALACRVALTEALRIWPENPEARTGWWRCRMRLLDSALSRRQLDGAEALLAELTAEAEAVALPDLRLRAERLSAERARAAADADAAAEGRRLAREFDERTSRRERRWFWGVLLGSTTGVLVLILVRGGLDAITVAETAFFALAVELALLLAAWSGRRALLANGFNRRLTGVVLWSMGALVLHRFSAWFSGELRVEPVLVGDLWILVGITGAAALAVQRLFGVVSMAFAACAVAASLFPAWTLTFFAVAPVVAVVGTLYAHGRGLGRAP